MTWLLCLLTFTFALSLFLGRYPGPYWTTPEALRESSLARRLILNLRLPRIAMAVLTGMVMPASGTVFQMIFRNPLVDSGFLSGGSIFPK
jgi:iron complex transport system permease protein